MKPNFALNLSSDSVQVLQRASTGWHLLGSTRFDVPDLDAAMARLRERATEAAPEGIRAKLVIPESELRYVTVSAPGPTDEARRHQIEAEIDGLTPYAIDELVYDFVVEGDQAMVVICARETLGEAEGFARAHDFNPVSFVAMPQPGHFPGEPFFGEVRGAGKLTRDIEPIRVTPRPATAPAAAVKAAAETDTKAALDPAITAAGMTPAGPAGRVAAVAQSAAPEALSRVGDLVRRMGTRLRREQAETPAPKAAQPAAPASPAKAPAPVPTASDKKPVAKAPEATKPVGKPEAEGNAPEAAPAEKAADKPADKPVEENAAIAFASRRRPVGNDPRPTGPTAPVKGPALVATGSGSPADAPRPGGRLAVLPPTDAAPRAGLMARLLGRGKAKAKAAEKPTGKPAPKPAAAAPPAARPVEPALKPLAPAAVTEAPAAPVPGSRPPASDRARNSEAEALTIFGARNRPNQEASFARRGLMLTGGLLLLLVAVAIWAAYFTTTPQQSADGTAAPGEALPAIEAPARLSAPETLPDAPSDAIIPRDTAATEAPAIEEPAAEELAAESTATEEAIPDEPTELVTEETTAPTSEETALTDPEQMLEELTQEALSEELPLDLLDRSADPVADSTTPASDVTTEAEGTAAAPQTPQLGEESGFASAERLSLPRPLELPQRDEVPLVSPAPPLPFGTQVILGADGLVEATPEGALTPQGVIVTAGRPSEVPPARPAGLAPEAAAPDAPVIETPAEEASAPPPAETPETTAQTAEEPATESIAESTTETATDSAEAPLQPVAIVVADDTPQADPALAGFRPEPRSERVAALGASSASDAEPPAEAGAEAAAEPAPPDGETTEADAETAPGEDASALPPAPGGVSLAALRPQQRPTDLVEPGVAATIAEGGTPEAVATSLVPSARPEDLSARIREALAEARQQPQATAPAQQTAAAAPGPQIPTSASVAERATQTRAINLRRINLVGVFGTPSDRRALVRLSDGRVVRVQVGDSLDGGRVSAIGDDELRYVRNGRNEILRIGQRS